MQWLSEAGALPVPVPNPLGAVLSEWCEAIQPGAIVLSGGNDVGQSVDRDTTERYLLDYAWGHDLPVLGVCRGMQMMNVWAGGDLIPVNGHVGTRHQLSGSMDGQVNSYHSFGITACPAGFVVLARAEDGGVEAIGHADRPWEGWMWHPERETEFVPEHIDRLRRLFGIRS